MDHYSTLGIDRTASQEDIKKAFRTLAREHHPDRGGDEAKFKQLNEAYTVLSDPQTRAQYDFQGNTQNQYRGFHPNNGGFQSHTFSFGDGFASFHQNDMFEDVMRNFGFQFHQTQQPVRNKDLNIRCRISLKDSYLGKTMKINYRMPSGEDQELDVNIPPGIENGQVLKMAGHGDNSIRSAPRGDLTIAIEVDRDPRFHREEMTLITDTEIDIFDAMIGCTKQVENIDGEMVDLVIRPGTQHGQRFSCKGLGFKHIRYNNVRGDLHVIVKVTTPVVTDRETITLVERLAEKVRRTS
jgi:curved DNA-binding protein